ncbi:unnamed protein product [Caenorhabditis sp. 36 PRJEB53466]|nr:unnamed protein product [Caenorhabditis sp. 36 PRJEB53466]
MVVELTSSYWVLTFVGIAVTFAQVLLNVYIFHKYTLKSRIWKKLEYQLILLRVVFDGLNGLGSFTYFTSSIPILIFPDVFPFDIAFLIALFGSNLLEMRSFLAAVISIERVLATTFPIEFYRYRNRISNLPIIGFIIFTGLSGDVVLFGFCGFRLPISSDCSNFSCATPTCYQNYLAATKIVYASLNSLFSTVLCFKLLWLSWQHTESPTDLRKANLLSLTDGLSTLLFDLLPSLLFNSGIINIKGPVMGVLRQMGRAVEAAVMVRLMKKTKRVAHVRLSASNRQNVH